MDSFFEICFDFDDLQYPTGLVGKMSISTFSFYAYYVNKYIAHTIFLELETDS